MCLKSLTLLEQKIQANYCGHQSNCNQEVSGTNSVGTSPRAPRFCKDEVHCKKLCWWANMYGSTKTR